MTTDLLTYDRFGSTAPDAPMLMLLHGILGSRRNWSSVARRLVKNNAHLRVLTVDLRAHGESPRFDAPHTVSACAKDLAQLCAHLEEEPTVLSGHSFGGKVAMTYALKWAAELRGLLVLDSAPGTSAAFPRAGRSAADQDASVGATDQVRRVIEKVHAISLPIADRKDLIRSLTASGLSLGLSRWMTTNLRRAEDGLRWSFDLEIIEELLGDYARLDTWAAVENPPTGIQSFVVRGGRSDRWDAGDLDRLSAIESARPGSVRVLEDAGHWLHADDLEGTLAAIEAALAACLEP